MINKLKKLTLTMMAAGATVAATRAQAVAYTNIQTLDNVSIQLTLYTQGALKTTTTGRGESLPVTKKSLNTADLLKQLAGLAGFTYAPSDKLVYSSIYSNVLFGVPGTTVTNSTVTVTNGATNLFYVGGFSGTTNNLPLLTSSATNSFYITNGIIFEDTYSGAGALVTSNSFYDTLQGGAIYTSSTGGTTFTSTNTINTNSIRNASGPSLGYNTTIMLAAGTSNAIITQTSPSTNYIFTNASSQLAVWTGTTGTGASAMPTLVALSNYMAIDTESASLYMEAGTSLSATNDFAGTNINPGQVVYSIKALNISAVYSTNGAPAANTNLYLTSSDSLGFSQDTYTHLNLAVASKKASVFDSLSSGKFTPAGFGYTGGTFAGTNTFTVVNGVTNFNQFVNSYVGTNLNGGYISGSMPVLYNGTVTLTFLKAFGQ
jgi:hypothetical protein